MVASWVRTSDLLIYAFPLPRPGARISVDYEADGED